jgi:hypothetical protein
VKVLIERTASSLDDTALKMLFVSVQQNNIELCIQYAIDEYVMFLYYWVNLILAFFSIIHMIEDISIVCPHCNPNDCIMLNVIQEQIVWQTMLWFGHSIVGDHHSIYWIKYSLFIKQLSVSVNRQLVSICHLWNHHQLIFVSEMWKLRRKRAM